MKIKLDRELDDEFVSGDIDSDFADCIVQVGCFGGVIYG